MKKEKLTTILSLAVNLAVAVLGLTAVLTQVFTSRAATNGVDLSGTDAFRFFTNDGNIFCSFVSVITVVANVVCLIKHKDGKLPDWLYLLRLGSAVTGMVIFLVVVAILTPTMGAGLLSGFSMIILHAVDPILIVASFLLLDRRSGKVNVLKAVWGIVPVGIYGVIAIILCVAKVWTGNLIPYPFLDVYNNPWWASALYAVGMTAGAYGLTVLFNYLNGKITAKLFA